jgi:hypothetical protein
MLVKIFFIHGTIRWVAAFPPNNQAASPGSPYLCRCRCRYVIVIKPLCLDALALAVIATIIFSSCSASMPQPQPLYPLAALTPWLVLPCLIAIALLDRCHLAWPLSPYIVATALLGRCRLALPLLPSLYRRRLAATTLLDSCRYQSATISTLVTTVTTAFPWLLPLL